MPVTNPKTGEQDYVNLSKVHEILIDSTSLIHLENKEVLKISYYLEPYSKKEVSLSAVPGSHKNKKETIAFPIQTFEEQLSEAVYAEEEKRLEEVEGFKSFLDSLQERIIKSYQEEREFYIKISCLYKQEEGLGLITDNRTGNKVGTFEGIQYAMNKSYDIDATLSHMILQSKTLKDLENDIESYSFDYYSPQDGNIYHLTPIISSNKALCDETSNRLIFNTLIALEAFNEEHSRYQTAVEAKENKLNFSSIDLQDQVSLIKYEEFKKARLSILKETIQKAKKEKIVNQFADIDLDL